MKLIEAVNAALAAHEMAGQAWPYDLALALVKVKKNTRDELEFFLQREQELVARYAATDADGHIKLTEAGGFVFRDGAEAHDYERARRELGDTDIGEKPPAMRVKAPAEIKPSYIEALEGFVELVTAP